MIEPIQEFDLGELAEALSDRDVVTSEIVQGKVISADAGNVYTVSIQGGVNISNIKSMTPLVADDIVWLIKKNKFYLVISHRDHGWQSASLVNSWVNIAGSYSTVRYRKVFGIVHVTGGAKNGNLATTVFTLPVRYRPALDIRKPIAIFDGAAHYHGMAYIDPAGNVQVYAGAGPANPIDEANLEFSFPAEA